MTQTSLLAVALAMIAVAVLGSCARGAAPAAEAFTDREGGPTIDHSALQRVLERVVTTDGLVDYERLRQDPGDLTRYVEQLAGISAETFDALSRDDKLALLINAYNAFTLRLMLDHPEVASIRDIPKDDRWLAKRWKLGPHTMSLDEIEHQWLRVKFVEPRIHFAIVCASVGCPPLRDEPFVASRIDEQLEDQARVTHAEGSRWFRFDADANTVHLPKIYDWFAGDFVAVAGSVSEYAARYSPPLRAALDAGKSPRVEWSDWDWSLNMPDRGKH